MIPFGRFFQFHDQILGGAALVLFMVIERFRTRDPVPIYARVGERGRFRPDGLKYVDS